MSSDERVTVEPWVVLYAIRYGLPRATYAHSDAISLTIEHAPVLRKWADTLIPDIRATETGPVRLFVCTDGMCLHRHDEAVAALREVPDEQ